MKTTRIHEISTFYGKPLPTKVFPGASSLPRSVVVVLIRSECVETIPGHPAWHIDHIGSPGTYFASYQERTVDILTNGNAHPIASTVADLHKHMRSTQSRRRELTFMELQARGITTCSWSADEAKHLGVPVSPLIQRTVVAGKAILELLLNSDEATQAMVTHTLLLQEAHNKQNARQPQAQRETRLHLTSAFA
ncbi:hypothetical protein [Marinobacter sp. ELB17]|uniref:hypothetical protein n=1 Tax=Marinobacter sp. ELB17 TaxID=270374 RepID=UPI0000F3B3BE|nr:hypothetical protein [Marinobacter sp. ELB17]EAZ98396.1 hypothetical protein MELB17_09223 [Marinobacter sp. ELB17]